MGKIKTEGRVTLEFEPDLYDISITVCAEDKTSGAAVTAGKQQTEQLLLALRDNLQIQPSQISAERETVDRPTHYDNQDPDYHFSRKLCLTIPADNKLRESITDLLAQMNDVTYMITERLSDDNKYKKTALNAAIKSAQQKAEQMAESLGSKVTGFEEIFTGGTVFRNMEDNAPKVNRKYGAPLAKAIAVELKKPKIKISGEVTVVWLTEPRT